MSGYGKEGKEGEKVRCQWKRYSFGVRGMVRGKRCQGKEGKESKEGKEGIVRGQKGTGVRSGV